ncbi:unnamed protein product [Spodoptera littoralis]|uniref:Uncharacterized protein n=1 Tax=Spodoptera littoralis TaxID=7109 RepID=A0A9P0HWM3_SPOLI|nr:unnamed protein product [Spodoptera littoralis]CAH1635874.1 unnamed protein product [Spodoptera littoralis]
MLRHRAFVLLTLFNLAIQISAEQTIYSDGWIPMSHNDIYEQIRRGTITTTQYPVYLSTKTLDDFDNNLNVEQRSIKQKANDVFKDISAMSKEPEPTNIKIDKFDQTTVYTKENIRKAKKVWDPNIDTRFDNVLALPEVDSKPDVSTEKTFDVITAATYTYEVTERVDTSPAEDSYTTESAGYQYNPPTDENQNLTSTFYRILSKYNIKTEDKLPNYELSLQRKVQIPTRDTNRVLIPYRYNSLNHLPADPLLAVFLSNYGFYLPSLYGIKANYNNLYGYLTSNNIHNNKPFGLYKVFSDTDSWN